MESITHVCVHYFVKSTDLHGANSTIATMLNIRYLGILRWLTEADRLTFGTRMESEASTQNIETKLSGFRNWILRFC
jgi:hypothetical protein